MFDIFKTSYGHYDVFENVNLFSCGVFCAIFSWFLS